VDGGRPWRSYSARAQAFSPGYRNPPRKDAEAFTEDRWFALANLGFMANEAMHLLGRRSTLIVTEAARKVQPE